MESALQLRISPEWAEVDHVRQRVMGCLNGRGVGDAIRDAIAMVASELAENAAKYGDFGPQDGIGVDLCIDPHAITIQVQNPVGEIAASHLGRLDESLQWIRGHQDPFEAYLGRVEEVALGSVEDHESGLGLVRIAYEGQSVLDFHVDEFNMLSVFAVYPL